jgi:hypothetical protein
MVLLSFEDIKLRGAEFGSIGGGRLSYADYSAAPSNIMTAALGFRGGQ